MKPNGVRAAAIRRIGVLPEAFSGQIYAASVDASTIRFAEAGAVHSAVEDVDGDGDLDMVLHFRVQDTSLADIYAGLLADDINQDGVLDSNRQTAVISLFGNTSDGGEFVASDEVDLFFSGKALRNLLEELAMAGAHQEQARQGALARLGHLTDGHLHQL